MPMRKKLFHACFLGVTLFYSNLSSADSAAWDGSYVSEGECFCSGSLGRDIDSQIAPTPIGGQSVSQICNRIGKGPELVKTDGKFNFTVYPDAQCGNGPFPGGENAISSNDLMSCIGHKGIAGVDCATPGPKWNLKDAYAKQAIPEPGIANTPVVTGGSRYIQPKIKQDSVQTTSNSISESETLSGTTEANTPVIEIVRLRSKSHQVVTQIEETPEQIRARQLVQMEAARARAAERRQNEVVTATVPAKRLVIPPAKIDPIDTSTNANDVGADEVAVETVATATGAAEVSETPLTVSALKLPNLTRGSSREFDYVEGMPVSFDFGGAGVNVAASVSQNNRVRFLLDASVADTYREAQVGAGVFITPEQADRLTVLLSAGIEYGKFEFKSSDAQANFDSTGAFANLLTRFVVNNKFELQGGVGYSSFFEGDATVFGAAFIHLNRNIDLTTKAEIGDNDSVGVGVRLYY